VLALGQRLCSDDPAFGAHLCSGKLAQPLTAPAVTSLRPPWPAQLVASLCHHARKPSNSMSLVTDNVDNVGWRASTPQLSLHRAKAVRADLQSNVGAIRVQTRGQAHLEP
jgi:hypothetical protein